MATSILLKFLTLKWNISRTIGRIEVGDGSFFAFFTLFHLSLTFFRPEVPFNAVKTFPQISQTGPVEKINFSKFLCSEKELN